MQLVNNAISVVWGNLTLDPLLRKNKNKTTNVRRCYFTAHTLILQKEHCKQSLHLRKALNGATEIDAGAAPPRVCRWSPAGLWFSAAKGSWLKYLTVLLLSLNHCQLDSSRDWIHQMENNGETSAGNTCPASCFEWGFQWQPIGLGPGAYTRPWTSAPGDS